MAPPPNLLLYLSWAPRTLSSLRFLFLSNTSSSLSSSSSTDFGKVVFPPGGGASSEYPESDLLRVLSEAARVLIAGTFEDFEEEDGEDEDLRRLFSTMVWSVDFDLESFDLRLEELR